MQTKQGEIGAINVLLLPLIISILFFFTALGFGVWAFTSRMDYKNNVDKKIEEANVIAVERTKTEKDNEFVEKEKQPLRAYKGPQSLGSFSVSYPKTWSVYEDPGEGGITVLAHPGAVMAEDKEGSVAYALKVEVINQPYDQVATTYESNITQGIAKARAFKLPKRPGVLGLRINGQIDEKKTGSAVLMPLRDKTIVVSTQSQDFLGDFNNIILKNFNFIP